MLESRFNKVADLTPILKNICQRLLLYCTCTTRCYLFVLLYIRHLLCLIITTIVNISDVCFWFQLKRLLKISVWYLIFTEVTFIGVIFFFHVFSAFLSFVSFFLVAANKNDSFMLSID